MSAKRHPNQTEVQTAAAAILRDDDEIRRREEPATGSSARNAALRSRQRRLLQQLAVFSEPLRGSESYMMKKRKELMAHVSSTSMEATDEHPLIFNTIAPADMHQPHLFRSILANDADLRDVADAERIQLLRQKEHSLTVQERFKLLGENPGLATHHFAALVKELERLLLSDAKPLGHILDIWYAKEISIRDLKAQNMFNMVQYSRRTK